MLQSSYVPGRDVNLLMHNVANGSDNKCCKIFKVCLTILGHYALKGQDGSYQGNSFLSSNCKYSPLDQLVLYIHAYTEGFSINSMKNVRNSRLNYDINTA